MRLREHPLMLLLLIMLAAFSARVGFACWWQFRHLAADQRFEFPDSASYWELGQRLATGQSYEFGSADRRAFRAPGYPLLLAGLFKIVKVDASPFAARLLGACIGTASVGLVYWCARPAFGATAGLWGAGLMAVDPGQIATSGFVLAEAPFSLWMLLQLGLWQRANESTSGFLVAGLSGIAAGFATLTRPSWLLFTPLLAVVGLVFREPGHFRPWVHSACALLGLALTLAPWTIRNWQVFHEFIPTSLQVGASLYDGLNPNANGGSDMRFVEQFTAELKAADANDPPHASAAAFEIRLDRRMRDAALEWTWNNPGRTLELAAIKFGRIWNPWPNEASFRKLYVAIPVAVSYTAVMALAIAGSWRHRDRCGVVALFWLPAIYFTLLHVVFVGSIRYRQPAMLSLAVLAGAAIASWMESRSSRFAQFTCCGGRRG